MDTAPGYAGLTLEAFVARLASSEPVPGGGSASAVAASLGAALVRMVASLSARPRLAAYAATHAEAGAIGANLAERFLALADEDSTAYARFSAAMKLPRDSVDQQAARADAIRAAARAAAEVPLQCVEACLELVRATDLLAGRSNPNASSDLVVASLLGEAAARGAAANVLVNLPSVGDESWAEDTRRRVGELLLDIEALARSTREEVQSGVMREPLLAGSAAGSVTGSVAGSAGKVAEAPAGDTSA